ncbi:MAG TPA: hypothetical protein VHW44_12545 [Pseudonocardiaceae bacterium]|nr:hypothetical protein [Pseudonocardiaceae bacterium]
MTAADTRAERREYLEAGLAPVRCQSCINEVLVRKASAAQTSIQWTTAAVRQCPEFAAHSAAGRPTALVDGCHALRDSIWRAVTEGQLEVPDA